MRLSRNDIVKQFEEVVKQEIINHNRQIESTNLSLNETRNLIENLSSTHSKTVAILDSKIRKIESSLLTLERQFESLKHNVSVSLNNFEEDSNRKNEKFLNEIDRIESEFIYEDVFLETIDELKKEIVSFRNDIGNQKVYVHSELVRIKQDFERLLSEFREDILNRPNELWEVKDKLERKISDAVVDAKGVLRSINIVKKDTFVMEKKIENLYTLIERLNKRFDDVTSRLS